MPHIACDKQKIKPIFIRICTQQKETESNFASKHVFVDFPPNFLFFLAESDKGLDLNPKPFSDVEKNRNRNAVTVLAALNSTESSGAEISALGKFGLTHLPGRTVVSNLCADLTVNHHFLTES